MSKNYIVFDSMMVPPQKNIFLLLYCIIFDNKFLLILRNSKLLSINFLCVTLSHMSIGSGVIVAIPLHEVDDTPHGETCAKRDYEGLQNGDSLRNKSHINPPESSFCCDLMWLNIENGHKKISPVVVLLRVKDSCAVHRRGFNRPRPRPCHRGRTAAWA